MSTWPFFTWKITQVFFDYLGNTWVQNNGQYLEFLIGNLSCFAGSRQYSFMGRRKNKSPRSENLFFNQKVSWNQFSDLTVTDHHVGTSFSSNGSIFKRLDQHSRRRIHHWNSRESKITAPNGSRKEVSQTFGCKNQWTKKYGSDESGSVPIQARFSEWFFSRYLSVSTWDKKSNSTVLDKTFEATIWDRLAAESTDVVEHCSNSEMIFEELLKLKVGNRWGMASQKSAASTEAAAIPKCFRSYDQNGQRGPIFDQLFHALCGIPPTSTQSERNFSLIGNFVTNSRTRMTSEHVDIFSFLKSFSLNKC